jgi:FtsP/CotA-like multicopper oxidase with cupredoxin domain
MVRTRFMPNSIFVPDRRDLMRALGAASFATLFSGPCAAQAGQTLRLEARPGTVRLRQDQASTPIWGLEGPSAPPRFKRGQLEVTFRNGLPEPAWLDWRGIDGAPAAEPLVSLPPVAPGAEGALSIPLRRAGSFFCDLRLPAQGQGQSPPSRLFPFIVEEAEPVIVDRDEIFLIEEWRLQGDGAAVAAGTDAGDATSIYTVNGQILPEISMRSNGRLRLRLINGCQHQAIAVKIDGRDVRILAMDGAPAEPFPARNSALVLAPGARTDALIDAAAPPETTSPILLHDGREAHPIARLVASNEQPVGPAPSSAVAALPADGLPAQLDLKRAQRVNLALQGEEWVMPASFSLARPPAFKAKAGGVVVLALDNRARLPTTFHLHGHHFRLLDRLDDGWKPFWLDTLVVEPGQTQRIAFQAEFSGRWLLESAATDWTAPRLVRCYSVK